MVKKGVLGAALSAGALYLVLGTSAPSYVKTAFHKARHGVKDSVPIQFQIDAARQQVIDLEPAILNYREELARAEVDVEHLGREIDTIQANLSKEKKAMVALRDSLAKGEVKLAGRVSYTPEEVKGELAHRLDHYRNVQKILQEKQATLKARQTSVIAAREKLAEMAHQKKALAIKLESIQAQLEAIEATQEKNEFNFDDSALSRAKQTVSDLERRLEVKARLAGSEGHSVDGLALPVDDGRDVVKEFDAEFGSKAKDSGDKSL